MQLSIPVNAENLYIINMKELNDMYIKKKKRVTALFIICTLIVGMLLSMPLATSSAKDGSRRKPNTTWYDTAAKNTKYTIDTADELAGLAKLVNAGNSFSGKIIENTEEKVTLYSEKNSKGKSAKIGIGEYNLEQLKKLSVDKIASIIIPHGLQVKLYRDEKVGGGYLGLEESQKDLTQSGWFHNIVKVVVQKYVEDEPLVKNYNYVLGTQIFDPVYGFYYDDWTYEAAEEMYKMGSNVLKTFGTFEREPSKNFVFNYKRILENMDFRHIYLWVYSDPVWKYDGGMNERKTKLIYNEMYKFVQNLLVDYNDTGKTFYIGHWEGDWYLLDNYDTEKKKLEADNMQGMIDWLNIRQKAIEDAKRDTPHKNVYVWGYAEANRTTDIDNGSERLVNSVLPNTTVDYLSYSSYDIQGLTGGQVNEYIRYMDKMIPAKKGVPNPGKRIFVGETGIPASNLNFNQERHNQENLDIFIKFFDAGVSQILYWEMYDNSIDNTGFWLIDNKGEKWKLYYSFKAFYCNAKEYVREYIATNNKTPNSKNFNRWASKFLKTLLPFSPQSLKELSSRRVLNKYEIPYGWQGSIDKTCFISQITKRNDDIVLPFVIPETDMTTLNNESSYIEFKLYINDIKLFNLLSFEITSSGECDKDEYQWNIEVKNLKTGWNTVRYSLHDSKPGTVGKPNLSKINFIRWYMIECKAGLQLKFDDFRIVQYNEIADELIVPTSVEP